MKGTPANGPPCDLNKACSVGESLGVMVPSTRSPWMGSVAHRCHPWRGRPGSMSSFHRNCSGRTPAANSCQEGAWNPAAARCSPEARTPAWKEGCRAWRASTIRAQTVGCLCCTICEQSAQLDQQAGLESNVALRRPKPPRDNGKLARSQ